MLALPLMGSLRPLLSHPELPYPMDVLKIAHEAHKAVIRSRHWKDARKALRGVSRICCDQATCRNEIAFGSRTIKTAGPCPSHTDLDLLDLLLNGLAPWRTGPYELFGLEIDSEWQSFMKWERIVNLLPKKEGLRIADVGCSNGYFLFRLSEWKPELSVGFDPVDRCWLQFALLQALFAAPNTSFIPAGLESLGLFPLFFDLVLCMGVIYHQRDPFTAVRTLYDSLRPGGQLIMESLTISVKGSYLLVPPTRYAKMRNAWHIPSAGALVALMERAGFEDITCKECGPLTPIEQRRTRLSPYESLSEFLDPLDHNLTVENLPAPHTAIVSGFRR